MPDVSEIGLDQDGSYEKQSVEEREPEHDPLPAPVVAATEREDHQHDPEQRRDAGTQVEVRKPDPDRDELSDQRDQVGEQQVAGSEPTPELSVALQDQLAISAVGDCSHAHAHLLADDRHQERDDDERQEESDSVHGAGGGVGDHAWTVVLPQHRQDSRPDEQPQQVPTGFVGAGLLDPGAVPRAHQILSGQRRKRERKFACVVQTHSTATVSVKVNSFKT